MSPSRRQLLVWTSLALAGCGGGGGGGEEAVQEAPVRPAADTPARASYRMTLSSFWTAAAFPTRFPSSAHLTAVVGATHGNGINFWAVGSAASPGVKDVAERGITGSMLSEVERAIANGTAETSLTGGGVPLGGGSVSLILSVSTAHPRVTFVTMLGPSPDWFTGVAGVSLLSEGLWLPSLRLPLRVYDAGTDDGASFISADAPTLPPTGVQALSTDPSDSDFHNGVHRTSGEVLASLLFERLP